MWMVVVSARCKVMPLDVPAEPALHQPRERVQPALVVVVVLVGGGRRGLRAVPVAELRAGQALAAAFR